MDKITITYKITFYSNWHCGTGLASGADADELVIKDEDGIPFIPGRTMKGLIRESFETLNNFDTKSLFGFFDEDDKSRKDEDDKSRKGELYFSNAILNGRSNIKIKKLQNFLYQYSASTSIENGIAKPTTLRRLETVIPCTLHGEIYNVPATSEKLFKDALKLIKRIGLNRNRGLGRCDISVISN